MDKTTIYIGDASAFFDNNIFEKYYKLVNSTRQKKIDGYKLEKDKCLSLAAEALFMEACTQYQLDYHEIEIETNEFGKPYIKNNNVYFNLSHSGTLAICVMSSHECGCDIELIEEAKLDVAKKCFTFDEYEKIQEEPDLFYKVWTLKESYTKCLGLGLKLKFNTFNVLDDSIKGYSFISTKIKNYYLSICLKGCDNFANLEEIVFK